MYACQARKILNISPSSVMIFGKKTHLSKQGRNFAELHKKQMDVISKDPELNKAEFRNKAISIAVLSSWAFVAGLLQNKKRSS